jgi:hypothetical protein
VTAARIAQRIDIQCGALTEAQCKAAIIEAMDRNPRLQAACAKEWRAWEGASSRPLKDGDLADCSGPILKLKSERCMAPIRK